MSWLHNEVISWVIHFLIFFTLAKWSGLKTWWAFGLTFGIEVWEMADWSLADPLAWWLKVDTWLDLIFGWLGIYTSKW